MINWVQVRALTFDLDDTLWELDSVIRLARRELYRWLDTHYPQITVRYSEKNLGQLMAQQAARQPEISHDYTALRKASLVTAATSCGYNESQAQNISEEAFQVFWQARNQVTLYPEVPTVLSRLKQDFQLAALTNGNSDPTLTGLNAYFDHHISAVDAGKPKPHPEMFYLACERLQCQPAEIVHVGDHLDYDVAGAAAIGMQTVWLNRHQQKPSDTIHPDFEINHLQVLLHNLPKTD